MTILRALLVGVLAVAAFAGLRRAAAAGRPDAGNPPEALRRIRALYDEGASRYDAAMNVMDRLLFGGGRQWACEQARGEVLEMAAGTGRNFAWYPADARLAAQDLSPVMLGLARSRAAALGRAVALHAGDAQALAFSDGRFDAVVCTLGLCTIPDDRRAIAEAWRVLRPGGRLLLLEHVRSPRPAVRFVQRLLDPLACRLACDHLLRDPQPLVVDAGFEVERVERRALGMVERLAARKPAAAAAG